MQIAVFISSIDVVKPGWLLKYLKGIRPAHIKAMQQNLAKMVGKVVNIKLHTRRSQRVVEGSRSQCTCECRKDW
ncbi:hypothetical protein AAZX31_07G099600 [Glycine max]